MPNLPKKLGPNRKGTFNLAETAQQDVREIWLYIAENNLFSADKLITELFSKLQLLANDAELGRIRNEFFLNLRSFPFKKYMIFYLPTEDGIEVFRVLHSSRNIEGIFEEFFNDLKTSENRW